MLKQRDIVGNNVSKTEIVYFLTWIADKKYEVFILKWQQCNLDGYIIKLKVYTKLTYGLQKIYIYLPRRILQWICGRMYDFKNSKVLN